MSTKLLAGCVVLVLPACGGGGGRHTPAAFDPNAPARLVLIDLASPPRYPDGIGPVQFGGGTLRFNNANSVLAATRTVTMLPNSFGVIDTTAGNQTIAGPITGSGGLVKINANTLTLSNPASDYSGPTTILQGNLVTTTGPQGNLTLSTTGGVTFTQAASGAYTGNGRDAT